MLWIQTDMHASQMYEGELAGFGSYAMLAADPRSGEVRRFLVRPPNCEVTGVVMTPDLRTMFVNIQHPGEYPGDRADPDDPARYSSWPAGIPVAPALGDGGEPQKGRRHRRHVSAPRLQS